MKWFVIGIVMLVIAAVVCIPFGFIWAINTLFAFGIPYTAKTWLASLILVGLSAPRYSAKSS